MDDFRQEANYGVFVLGLVAQLLPFHQERACYWQSVQGFHRDGPQSPHRVKFVQE